jgi:hypothetical protein
MSNGEGPKPHLVLAQILGHENHNRWGKDWGKEWGGGGGPPPCLPRSVPAVVIDGKLADCCTGRGPDEATLRAAGLGQPI